ncbi:21775_t:CDS:2, partial [Dentiscutata erythropus]
MELITRDRFVRLAGQVSQCTSSLEQIKHLGQVGEGLVDRILGLSSNCKYSK